MRTAVTLGGLLVVGCSGSELDDTGAGGAPSSFAGTSSTAGTTNSGGASVAGATSAAGSSVGPGGFSAGGTTTSGGSTANSGSSTAGTNSSPGGMSAAGSSIGGASSGGSATAGSSAVAGTSSGGTSAGGSSNGGSATAGMAAGGTAAGGTAAGGAPMGGSNAGGATGNYPCSGTTTGYNAVMTKSGSTWTVVNAGRQAYSGSDMEAALRAAYGSLTSGRTTKQSILVQGSGDIPASSQVGVPSYTILNVCGTINVSGTPSGSDRSPLYIRNARDVEIPNLKMTGAPQYGIFVRQTDNVHLGQIDLRLTSAAGIGIRADNGPNAGSTTTFNQNLKIDYVYGSGMGSHVVETYGISNIQIGTVEGNNVGECGLLLNRSINAQIGLVNCTNCSPSAGYAAFRMANRNGAINGNTNTVNVTVGRVVARGGGRGIFCVSQSGGARINHIDIQDTGNNSILIENCYNVTVGNTSQQSRVANSGELRISARTEFANTSDITFQNIAVSGTAVRESPCATNSTWINVTGAPTNCN